MAIYSFNVSSIGKGTHAAGTAGAHLAYIGREGAEPILMSEHMPEQPAEARTWMDREERADRANARLGDKLRVALPREMTTDQRQTLVAAFMAEIGGGRVPWYAGIHQSGCDEHNPHAHIFVRDRDVDTGKRVLRLSDSARDRTRAGLEPKAVEWLRERWEIVCNDHLARAGIDVRIDRRTLEAQGVDREPTIHLGPRGQHVEQYVQRPRSKQRTNALGRVIDYPEIDRGRTRKERHAEIEDLNLERQIRSPELATRERAKFEKAQRAKDRALESRLTQERRERTLAERRLKGRYRQQADHLRAREKAERHDARMSVAGAYQPVMLALRQTQAAERQALKERQSAVWRRALAALDITGITRRRREDARKALSQAHQAERRTLAQSCRRDLAQAGQSVAAKYAGPREAIITSRESELQRMKAQHKQADIKADAARQAREAERERERVRLDRVLRIVGNARSDMQRGSGSGSGRSRGPEPGLGR